MPSYVSKSGRWTPAQEKNVVIKKENGENELYSGPCREAVKELAAQGVEYFGQDYRDDPEFIEMIRAKKYESIDEYLKIKGITKEKENALYEKNYKETIANKAPSKKKNIVIQGGGVDTSGSGNSVYGKFASAPI